VAVEDPGGQERLAQRIVAEGLSVRAVEELVALGEGAADKPRRSRLRSGPDPRHEELSRQLGDRFETRVRIEGGRSKGRIVIDFADAEDLARIAAELQK
jgi:ParB family chromosome partitioning protein